MHAQFVNKANRSETKFKIGASDRNSPPGLEPFPVTTEARNDINELKLRVCNSKYEPTAMNDFMRSVKHLTQVLIVSAYCVDP